MNKNKLLSICIPTYNRAEFLRALLHSLIPQVKDLNNEIEIIISDNASSDDTEQVVNEFMQSGLIRYNKNEKNLLTAGNLMKLTTELAVGEYCWIIGDDDMINNGGLSAIIDIIKQNRNINFFFLNSYVKKIFARDQIIYEQDSQYKPKEEECSCKNFKNIIVDKWEDLFSNIVSCDHPLFLYAGVMSCIFKTDEWRKNSKVIGTLNLDYGKDYVRLDNVYPHTKIFAHFMIGKPVFYIGEPFVLNGDAEPNWEGLWPAICIKCNGELLELYEKLGVEHSKLKTCWKDYYELSAMALYKMMNYPENASHIYISFEEYMQKLSSSPDFLKEFAEECRNGFSHPKYKAFSRYAGEMFNCNIEKIINNKNVALWGFGEIGEGLLTYSDVIKNNVSIIVDASPGKQGKKAGDTNLIIKEPFYLVDHQVEYIILATEKYVDEIIKSIREKYGLKVKIITYKGVVE